MKEPAQAGFFIFSIRNLLHRCPCPSLWLRAFVAAIDSPDRMLGCVDRFFMSRVALPVSGPSHGFGRSSLQSIHRIDCSGCARPILHVECYAAGARPFAWLRAFVAAIDPLDRLLGLRPTAAHPFPIRMPAARTRLPPTTTWKAARRNGVSIYLFWMKAIAQSSKKTMTAAVMVAVQNCGMR
ncbi:hypothetical protein PMI11_00679 [Rhizobium sp. CF142]|nr:hypothetical protein PMI11_00679 [Rhizobium sp. CF142]